MHFREVFWKYRHGIVDVLHYMIWGNSDKDTTDILDRMIMATTTVEKNNV